MLRRWITGDWSDTLPVKLKAYDSYVQPLVKNDLDKNSITVLLKRISIDINDIVVSIPSDFDKISLTIGGKLEYSDKNCGKEQRRDPCTFVANITTGLSVKATAHNLHYQLLDPTAILFKANYAVNEPPLLSIHLKNILRIHISKNAVKICTSLIKSQINLFRTYSVKRVLFDVSQFVDVAKELLISSNIIIKFPSIHILSPDLPCDLFNEDFSCNKSERFCGGLSITSLSLFQLIRVHTINLTLKKRSCKLCLFYYSGQSSY